MGQYRSYFVIFIYTLFRKPGGKNSANGGPGDKGMPENAHIFQEYTYKKITPCDICSQILRGELKRIDIVKLSDFMVNRIKMNDKLS